MIKKNKKSKNTLTKKYSSYNKITKEYDVYILSNEEYDKLSNEEKKEVKHMVLKKKTDGDVTPPGPPIWALTIKDEILQQIVKLGSRLDNVIKKNNLKE